MPASTVRLLYIVHKPSCSQLATETSCPAIRAGSSAGKPSQPRWMMSTEPSLATRLTGPGGRTRSALSNFLIMSVFFSLNHGCVVAVLNISVQLLGDAGSYQSGASCASTLALLCWHAAHAGPAVERVWRCHQRCRRVWRCHQRFRQSRRVLISLAGPTRSALRDVRTHGAALLLRPRRDARAPPLSRLWLSPLLCIRPLSPNRCVIMSSIRIRIRTILLLLLSVLQLSTCISMVGIRMQLCLLWHRPDSA